MAQVDYNPVGRALGAALAGFGQRGAVQAQSQANEQKHWAALALQEAQTKNQLADAAHRELQATQLRDAAERQTAAREQLRQTALLGAGLDETRAGYVQAAMDAGAEWQGMVPPEQQVAVRDGLQFSGLLDASDGGDVGKLVDAFAKLHAYQQIPGLRGAGQAGLSNALVAGAAGNAYTPFDVQGGYQVDKGTGAATLLATGAADIARDRAAAGASNANAAESYAGVRLKGQQALNAQDYRQSPERYRAAGGGGAEAAFEGMTDDEARALYTKEHGRFWDANEKVYQPGSPILSDYVTLKMAERENRRKPAAYDPVRVNAGSTFAKVLGAPGVTKPLTTGSNGSGRAPGVYNTPRGTLRWTGTGWVKP